jgi:steroid 5-alpha reductase family enzyme
MTFFLIRVSGAALLEKTLVKTKPEYRDYISRTSGFLHGRLSGPPSRVGSFQL